VADIVIRAATREDAATVLDLQYLGYQTEAERYQNDKLPPLTQTLASLQGDIERMTVLVATLDAEIVGTVRGRIEGATCHVGRLVTHPRMRRQGIATRLMAALEQRFPEAQRFALFTGARSVDTIRLYERLG
jgi:GNAT superfamily N-acetyltransferase